jgi:uncharacterized membrane protein
MDIGDGLYQTILVIHILAAVVAFGPNFALPAARRAGDGALAKVGELATFVQLPALFGVLITGIGMLTAWPDVDDKSAFAQVWVSVAFVLVILAAVLTFVVGRAARDGKDSQVAPLSGVLHLVLVAAIVMMVVQPG